MGTVQVIFSRRHHLGSLALRTFLWDAWSHCGVIDGDTVIEAAMFKGVQPRSVAEFKATASKWAVIDIPAEDPAAVIAAARSRIGRPYDWFGVLSLLLRVRLQRDSMDFCSELVAWAFKQGGSPLFRTDTWRITPRDLYIRVY